jgi:hypothetical protein
MRCAPSTQPAGLACRAAFALGGKAMKSILGLVAALFAAAAFTLAYYLAARPGAGWLDGQYVFLAALPYNWTMLRLTGVSNFSADAPAEVASAALFDVALAFLAGALLEISARSLWRLVRRGKARA